MKKIYTVKFENKIKPYFGFIKPWNSVRDGETWSLTYLPPSFIDGIKDFLNIENNIIRHKLIFDKNGMTRTFTKAVVYDNKNKHSATNYIVHELVNPVLILGFETKEDAEYALTKDLYVGRVQYPIYGNADFGIQELTTEEFDNLEGVETFVSNEDDENAIYVGNNRQKNNERMYINLIRNEWYSNSCEI